MELLWIAGVGLLAHSVETALGFGGTLIALALGAQFVPLPRLLAALVLLTFLQAAWRVAKSRHDVRWDVLGARILPVAGAGLAVGIVVARFVPADGLKMLLGVFVVGLAALELARLARPARALPEALGLPLLFAGGVLHGVLATGGPLVVYYASRKLPEPAQFRATLAGLWLVLNGALLLGFLFQGRLGAEELGLVAALLPSLVAGVALGSLVRMEPRAFRAVTYSVLLMSGALLLR